MKRYILTGAPGSGKTLIIRSLEMKGYSVVSEAATDLIAFTTQALGDPHPWERETFIDEVVQLQTQREEQMAKVDGAVQFYDRSVFCTYALALHLNYPLSEMLLYEVDRALREKIYERKVFFIENLGFITHTEARKISWEENVAFEKTHYEVYAKFGFECIKIPPASVLERMQNVLMFL